MEKNKRNYKEFIHASGVDEMIEDLKKQLALNNNGEMPIYSDLVKKEGDQTFQYINYVQEGGGVLGVGLIGYTYVLEKLGMRFLKLAGTSAGAINTIMLAGVDKENYRSKGHDFTYKSEIVLQEMLDYDLWKLVDGSNFGKQLIKMFINSKHGPRRLKWMLALSVVIPIFYAFIMGLAKLIPDLGISKWLFPIEVFLDIVTMTALIILFLSIALILYYAKRFSRAGFGINPGKSFYDWVRDILARNNIKTTADLDACMEQNSKGLQLRQEREASNDAGDTVVIEGPFLTIVASDITNETKVEFPLMAKDYWSDPFAVNPADYVRASMSIPIFFEPFTVTVEQHVKERSDLQQQKQTVKRNMKNRYVVSFVDGGILSNFPINVFHNPKIKIARMPTFGVKLEDEAHIKTSSMPLKKSKRKLLPFLAKIFSTVRFYYDRDFLKRNAIYEMSIAHVDVSGFNWLNFGISDESQLELFKRGAEAAKTFFLGGNVWVDGKEKPFEAFSWQKFKDERAKIVEG